MTITDSALDAHLRRWATKPAGDSAAVERIITRASLAASAAAARRSRPVYWAGGGLLAAALAGGLLVSRPAVQPTAPTPASASVPPATAEASFRALYTPTPDEEQFL